MFLEAQFGSDSIQLITRPRLVPVPNTNNTHDEQEQEQDNINKEKEEEEEAAEIKRLQSLHVPIPGIQITLHHPLHDNNNNKTPSYSAKIWLENLQVESSNRTFRDRVQAVVERAVETLAPLWVSR